MLKHNVLLNVKQKKVLLLLNLYRIDWPMAIHNRDCNNATCNTKSARSKIILRYIVSSMILFLYKLHKIKQNDQ